MRRGPRWRSSLSSGAFGCTKLFHPHRYVLLPALVGRWSSIYLSAGTPLLHGDPLVRSFRRTGQLNAKREGRDTEGGARCAVAPRKRRSAPEAASVTSKYLLWLVERHAKDGGKGRPEGGGAGRYRFVFSLFPWGASSLLSASPKWPFPRVRAGKRERTSAWR